MTVKDVLSGHNPPIPAIQVLNLDVDGDPSVFVGVTPANFDVITRVILVMRFAGASVLWSNIANDTALTNGFQLSYDGSAFGPLIKDNGDFFDVGYDVNLNSDGAGTPNHVLAARWTFEKFTPHGLALWDGQTFGFDVNDDMTAKTTITSLEAIVEGWLASS
jgi:hypothetical protein